MPHPAVPEHSDYYQALATEDERLTDTLAAIRADFAAGEMTVREAADNRISALEAHLAKCQELRRKYLGE